MFFLMITIFFKLECSTVGVIINLSSAGLMFFYVAIGFIASSFKFTDIKRALIDALNSEKPDLKSIDVCDFFEKMVIFASIFGVFSGIVMVLSFIGAGGELLGRAVAITIMPAVHGVMLYTFAYILKSRVKSKLIS